MKRLAQQLIEHVREDWDPVIYGFLGVWLTFLLTSHYQWGWYDQLQVDARPLWRILPFVAFYGIPWGAVVAVLAWRGRLDLSTPGFFRFAALAIGIMSFADWFPYHVDLAAQFEAPLRHWVASVAWNMKSTLCYFTPIFLFWRFFDRDASPSCYGLTARGFDPKPYLICLGILFVLAAWASFQPDFLRMYPTYRPGPAEVHLGVSPWVTVLFYEFFYGFDFSFVELFYRGFLVIGMVRWLGRSAVLPMVAMYAVLHFGKPFAETIGSIVGGYILGVFAYKSRSILGGIILHLGLAWTMEVLAFLQHAWAE